MLKHPVNLALFLLLLAFATPSAAEQTTSKESRADSCGYVCVFTGT